ncbi:plasmid pRiA4b ORF-3-like protein-domain-containing protein [Clohesyomyces aquaticus]|uniref:Plasmid pRiA4b ORF-3-like protein-domain-containing protein n=1 Tax=Clohesyomyces aquaticus TaxID=1231657 RepID=A0A1Y1ZQ13_9PLEO|nr:plasmid pRiA4b ORF-3-like protein-domain-containing protein [Clohesyomyces aquaticus]
MSTPNSFASPASVCDNCGKTPSTSTSSSPKLQLSKCSRCKAKWYCSEACQIADWDAHRPACKRPNYILQFNLVPDIIRDPAVFRTLSVPATTTFAKLHNALQVAFGWANTHGYDFAWADPAYDSDENEALDREGFLECFEDATFWGFRKFVLRLREKDKLGVHNPDTMGGHVNRTHPETKEKSTEHTKLFKILDDKEYSDLEMEYMYDFGDNWRHDIIRKGRAPPTSHIVCLDGRGHGVAQDATITGWEALKEAYRSPSPNEEQRDNIYWYENEAMNGDSNGLGGGGPRARVGYK